MVLAGTVPGAAALARTSPSLLPGPIVGPSLTITPGREFAAGSYVYRPLSPNAKLDPKSRTYVASLLQQLKRYYGHADVNVGEYTPSIFIVAADQPTVRVKAVDWSDPKWTYPRLQARWNAVPLPKKFAPAQGTDEEAVVYQPSTHRMWEFWLMRKTGAKIKNSAGGLVDEWGARWGGRMDNIQRNPGYWITTPQGDTFGTTAIGMPFLAGMLTVREQQRGVINHVLGVGVPDIAFGRCSFPAQRCAPTSRSADAIPEGTMFRLPAALNLDALPMDPYARMLAKAVQSHGMVVWDSAGTVGFRAENPTVNYARDPYYSRGGIFRCPAGTNPSDPPPECWSYNRLRGFPWSKLQVLKPMRPASVAASSVDLPTFVMGIRTLPLNDSTRPPAKGVVVRDSLFGTEIVRVTDKAVDHYPAARPAGVRPTPR